MKQLGPSCTVRKTRLWRSPSKPSTSREVRNTLVQGIVVACWRTFPGQTYRTETPENLRVCLFCHFKWSWTRITLSIQMKLNTNYTFYSIVICTIVFDLRLLANGRDNSQYCWPTMLGFVASVSTWRKVWAISNLAQQLPTTSNNMQRTQHVASNNVGSCWPKMLRPFARGFTFTETLVIESPFLIILTTMKKTLFISTMSILISTDFNYSCLHTFM